MIRELVITDPTRACIPWWSKVEWLQGRERIEFKPGLNVIYGPNGTGKSTVLTAIARMLFCEQGGRQLVTHEAMREIVRFREPSRMGVLPVHDGSPVMHFDPSATVGLMGGGAAFDWDFGMEGIRNAMFKGSSGQTTAMRINEVIQALHTGKWPKLEWQNDSERYDKDIVAFLKGSFPAEGPTVILDEPSRSLDLRTELGLWRFIDKAVKQGVQVIMATHSIFPLVREAHFIETQPNYIDRVRLMVETDYVCHLIKDYQKAGLTPQEVIAKSEITKVEKAARKPRKPKAG